MGNNADVANAGKPGLWRRKQTPCGLLCALGGTSCLSHTRGLKFPKTLRTVVLQGPRRPHELRWSGRLGRPAALLLLLRRPRPAQSTCSEVTGAPPNPPRRQQPQPERVPNAGLRAAARPHKRGGPDGPRTETVEAPRTQQPRISYRGAAILASHDLRSRTA